MSRQVRWAGAGSCRQVPRKIGKKIDARKADCEFVGMVFFHESGFRELRASWLRACREFKNRPFYEAASVAKAGLTDLLQYMIDRKTPVYGMEVEHGWSEVHSREDYRRVSEYFQNAESLSNVL